MNVSATTLVANTAKVGTTTTDRIGTVSTGKITTLNTTGTTTITGDLLVKTSLGGPIITEIQNTNTSIRNDITTNITQLVNLETRKQELDSLFDDVSGEFNRISQNEFPTADKIFDISNRCFANEASLRGISNEAYLLETANTGGYPLDAELNDLSGKVDVNIADLEILFIRVYGLKDDALDGDFISVSQANALETRIANNEIHIQDASEGYAYALANANTLSTQVNYDDLSSRTTDVSNTITPFIHNSNLFNINDVNARVDDLSENTKYTEDLCNGLITDIQSQTPRIIDLSQNISITTNGLMFGVNTIENVSGIVIGENSTLNATYFNSKVTDIRGPTTISGTAENIIQPRSSIQTDYINETRDVSSIIVNFTSSTPYSHTHHIILDPSEGIIGNPPDDFTGYGGIFAQSDGGVSLDLRISRLSKSRRIVVTVPPATASRMTISLYDDDTFSSVNGGYGISDERRTTMESNMGQFKNLLTGSGLTNGNLYNIRDSIQISPGCAPAIDISFLNLNTTQKTALVTLLELDTTDHINPTGVSRLQYPYNPINVDQRVLHGGSIAHIVRDICETEFIALDGTTQGDYNRLQFLSAMNETEGINNPGNVTLNGLPSFLMNQTLKRSDNGNRFDVIFGGASRLIHNTANTPPFITNEEIASPFDYYGGNSYTFEINLVSTGRPQDKDLAKIYITEKTRQAPLRRFYKSSLFSDVNNNEGIFFANELVGRFNLYQFLRTKIYKNLVANPVVSPPPLP